MRNFIRHGGIKPGVEFISQGARGKTLNLLPVRDVLRVACVYLFIVFLNSLEHTLCEPRDYGLTMSRSPRGRSFGPTADVGDRGHAGASENTPTSRVIG